MTDRTVGRSAAGAAGRTSLEDDRPSFLALGIERFGLIPLHFPLLAAVIVLLLAIGAGYGVVRIKVDDSLSQLFRSDTPEFHQFEEVSGRFPSSEYDVLIVVEGKTLLDREPLQKLGDFVTDLQLMTGVRGVVSLFSARGAPVKNGIPPPLFPNDLPEGEAYKNLIAQIKANDIIRGKLLSDDGQLALVVMSLDPAWTAGAKLGQIVGPADAASCKSGKDGVASGADAQAATGGVAGDTAAQESIRCTIARDLAGTGLRAELSGVPVMQLEIRDAVERDTILYNSLGFAAGCLIAIVFFRRISFMVVAAAPPLIAILLALGLLGWLDFRLNMFLNVMTPLIMVISFSDSMQLTFAARDRLLAGQSRFEAFRHAVYVVGPACVLTHATAAISFIALQVSSSELIRTFGQAGLISTAIALAAVLTLVPLLGVLLVRREGALVANVKQFDYGVDVLRAFCRWIAVRMVRHPGIYSLVSLVIVALLAWNYAGLQPRYRLADQVPDKRQAVQASHHIDAKLTGANPIDVLIQFPPGVQVYDPRAIEAIAQVHTAVEKQAGVGNVWSLETLRRWLKEKAGTDDVKILKEYIDLLPKYLVQRFLDDGHDAVVVSGRIPDSDASQLLPIVKTLDKALDKVRAEHPGFQIAVTGLAVIAARNSAAMIDKLNAGLTIEVVFVAAFIGLAFRSIVVMFASILPGVFPILVAGTLLAATGQGLQFSSVVALTVSFGLGLSATIHFINRMRREVEAGDDPAASVERATVLVGPALILTSVVLACGLAMTVFSDLPSLRLFGWLSAFAMLTALIADLLILRPTITFLMRLSARLRHA